MRNVDFVYWTNVRYGMRKGYINKTGILESVLQGNKRNEYFAFDSFIGCSK